MGAVACFWVDPTGEGVVTLRRFTLDRDDCPGDVRYHNAGVDLGERRPQVRVNGDHGHDHWQHGPEPDEYAGDSRWPTVCAACPYVFDDREDRWQVRVEQLYRRADGGEEYTLRTVPPGAMWDAWWYPWKGDDGRSLCVALPPDGGLDYWAVDGPSTDGGRWTRTGVPPLVTANPSILTPRYHGFLRDGELVE